MDEYVRHKKLEAHWPVAEGRGLHQRQRSGQDLIARGARISEVLRQELYVLHVAIAED